MHVPCYFVALLGRDLPPSPTLMLLFIQNISLFLIGSNHGQLVLTLSDIQGNMTPIVMQAIASTATWRKGCVERLSCFGRAGEKGKEFHTFCQDEIAELLPKNVARSTATINTT